MKQWAWAWAGGWLVWAGIAAAGAVEWPSEWLVFGPVIVAPSSSRGLPDKSRLPSGDTLKAIPEEFTVANKVFKALKLRMEEGRIDFARKLCGAESDKYVVNAGTGAYLFAPVEAVEDTTVQVGAGAGWWMQWWLDGEPVFDTIVNGMAGNKSTPVGARDHQFTLKLTKGRHVLAVAVFAGKHEFLLAVTSPREMRAKVEVSFMDALETGRRKYRIVQRPDYPAAKADFQRALQAAATDVERAEARLAIADNCFYDDQTLEPSSATAIREELEAALALPGAAAEQKAKAMLLLGEAFLLEGRNEQAREHFAKALDLSQKPGWAETVRISIARSWAQQDNAAAKKELAQVPIAALDNPLRFTARSLLGGIEVAPRVRPDHPRLFFNAETWPAVKARLEADANGLEQLKKRAKGLPNDGILQDWGLELMPAALVYRLTGDKALLANIAKLLRATIEFYSRGLDTGGYARSRVGCAAALDWVWNDLPTAEREGIAHDLLRFSYGSHVQDMIRGSARGYDHDAYYYYPAMHWYIGLATLDPQSSGMDYLRALTVLGRGYDNNVVACFGPRMILLSDGGVIGSEGYAFQTLPEPVWSFLHCWQSAMGPVPPEWVHTAIAPEYVLRYVLGVGKGHIRTFGYGKSWRYARGEDTRRLYNHLAQFIHFFGKTHPGEASIAGHLRQRMTEAGCSGEGEYPIYPYLLNLEAAPPPKLPDNLPIAHHYAHFGQVLMSSGFDDNATYILFSCGSSTALPGGGRAYRSAHFDAGHFTIYKQGYLALDSGTRALGQDTEPELAAGGINYDTQSVAHNTVLIRMPDEAMPGMWGRKVAANSGGQRNGTDYARTLAFESSGTLFAYTATDATETYHTNKCAQMVRQFLFLPPDHVVVFDRVVSKNADFPKSWLLHTANEPAIAGKEFRADQGQGRIFCRTLLPVDAVVEKIGGPGKEFWADGRNWPIAPESSYFKSIGMKDGVVPENIGRWRVEVKLGAARTDDCFLHWIQVGDKSVLTAMTPSSLIEDEKTAGVEFQAGARSVRVVFHKDGDVGGHIRIAEGTQVLADRPLATSVQRQDGPLRPD